MDLSKHTMSTLFAQLGLPNDDKFIARFILQNTLPEGQPIYEASCFNDSQTAFLAQGLDEDSDWTELIDSLDAAMRAPH
ncbi:DUF2789 domain-containing protein [Oceanospirillum sediminis]|uniref:DUF2789 domain-containing protein n=1 Tax=Oceanospirillum sediminis TaxID=2760088 RepID=A0A839IM22_9GAMM|nr:DUF2789 domain-containing protein [Oceanospirillum sediminis]MBB1486008.1 DUF2789 domain-containing protein [Oceanospirillum sediminis]